MSIKKYLEQLDMDQLLFAKEQLDRLLDAKEKEKMIPLYVVTNGAVNVACFKEEDLYRAKLSLIQEITKFPFCVADIPTFLPKIHKLFVRESELPEMMELND